MPYYSMMGTAISPIRLDEDNGAGGTSRLETRLRNIRASGQAPSVVAIDHEIEELVEHEVETELGDLICLGEEPGSAQRAGRTFRNPPIPLRAMATTSRYKNLSIKVGDTVEIMQRPHEQHRIQFLRVSQMYRDQEGMIILRGLPLTRLRYSEGMLARQRNELYAPLDVDEDDARDWHTQSAIEVPVYQVLKLRTLQCTNAIYPEFRYERSQYMSDQAAEDNGILTYRWNIVTVYKTAKDRENGKMSSRIIQHHGEKDAEGRLRISDETQLNRWRGGRVRGGAFLRGQQRPVISIDDNDNEDTCSTTIHHGQKYNFGDMYCGAGGTSVGAKLAGFETVVACDMWSAACKSYRKNFPTVDLREMEITDFVNEISDQKYRLDVMHISPPCQVWSPAHTREGSHDEANLAALYACGQLLQRLRPRIVTVEQTFGILHDRFREYFHLFINTFTSMNYSISYKVPLPPFPDTTNFPAEEATVADALATIGPRASLQNVQEMYAKAASYRSRFPLPAYDPCQPLRRTITTDGGGNYYPSGKRDFTLREYAALQGFPSNHGFEGPAIKKQIGNAFSPRAVEYLYRHLRSWLMQRDNVVDASEDGADAMILDTNPWVVVDTVEEDDDDDDDVIMVEWRERSRTASVAGDAMDID
ncbi:S-adenosyl-L-methionine-dependent methyltransferase [Whalleya microplaca]|nr:S-adenosyl-L-methionine-dependent methyltransferase [Whalleya microplaca]